MGRLWSRKSNLTTPLIRRLWSQTIHHEADNIFTAPPTSDSSPHQLLTPNSLQTSPFRMDEECRGRLLMYYKYLDDDNVRRKEFTENESRWTPQSPFEAPPGDSKSTLPSLEILDSSLDLFFQFFHPTLPFIHKGTFDARNTPSSLLFAMCLAGLSHLDRMRTREFVCRCLRVRII